MVWSEQGNGCDKHFYVETSNSNNLFGAIICSQQVAARERAAHGMLQALSLSILPEIIDWTDPGEIEVRPHQFVRPQYMIRRIVPAPGQERLKTLKPIMATIEVPRLTKIELKRGNQQLMLNALEELLNNLERVCQYVGEITLAVDNATQRLYMLDFSPGPNGETAMVNIVAIRKGLNNYVNFIKTL